jgi:anti-sigma factor ChrR (cupin superfamily)
MEAVVASLRPWSIRLDDVPWSPLRPGISICRLFGDGLQGPSAALLRYEPGASVPLHAHEGVEVVAVLSGSQRDAVGAVEAVQVRVNPAGTQHFVASAEGCVALLCWQAPVSFL